MVLDYVAVDVVRDDDVCPMCSSDLIIRVEGSVVFVSCIDCCFSQCSAY